MELKLYFSMISGELYSVEADEVKNLDKSQVPLKQKPNPSCRKCNGRFYIGKEMQMIDGKWQPRGYMLCPRCAKKCIDFDKLGSDDIVVETPRTTNELA